MKMKDLLVALFLMSVFTLIARADAVSDWNAQAHSSSGAAGPVTVFIIDTLPVSVDAPRVP